MTRLCGGQGEENPQMVWLREGPVEEDISLIPLSLYFQPKF